MSWVFLAGDRVYKLKKPVRFPYLDFSTLNRRESACRAELRLNRRLAPDVYLDVLPLVARNRHLSIGGPGAVVEWLVMMKRLDEHFMLDRTIADGRLDIAQLNRLGETLCRFYRTAAPIYWSPAAHISAWRQSLAYNRRVLLNPHLGLPSGPVRWIDQVQRRFLDERSDLVSERFHHRHVIDGHGDLRPEHIWLHDKIQIIDCLEFSDRLRAVDPLDEVAFLSLECRRLGAAWAADYLERQMKWLLRDGAVEELFAFYSCHRATLRARLAIAHLLEENPRTPEKWPRTARTYIDLAKQSAYRLETLLKIPSSQSNCARRASAG
jgi:aminoglycoside phosphotransferase family enzyme